MLLDMLARYNKKVKILSNDKFKWYDLLTYNENTKTIQKLPNRIDYDRTGVFDNMEPFP